jgi:hypothetical protein
MQKSRANVWGERKKDEREGAVEGFDLPKYLSNHTVALSILTISLVTKE